LASAAATVVQSDADAAAALLYDKRFGAALRAGPAKRRKRHEPRVSRTRGVNWNKHSGKWRAVFETRYLGEFSIEFAASEAHAAAEREAEAGELTKKQRRMVRKYNKKCKVLRGLGIWYDTRAAGGGMPGYRVRVTVPQEYRRLEGMADYLEKLGGTRTATRLSGGIFPGAEDDKYARYFAMRKATKLREEMDNAAACCYVKQFAASDEDPEDEYILEIEEDN
jgi:hypothetical protein